MVTEYQASLNGPFFMSPHNYGHLGLVEVCIEVSDVGDIGIMDFDDMERKLVKNALCSSYLVALVRSWCVNVT